MQPFVLEFFYFFFISVVCTDLCTIGDNPTQEQQEYVVVPSNSTVDFEVSLNTSTTKIDQKVWLNGKLVSQQSDGMLPLSTIALKF